MSSSDETQEQIAELRAEHNRLTTAVTLRHKQDDLKSLESDLTELSQSAQKLTQSGYAGGAALSGHIQSLTAQLGQARALFAQVLTVASARLQAELGQANLGVGGALGGQTALLDSATEALSALSERVETAEGQLDSVLESVSEARYNLESVFRVLTWSLDEWNEFSGDKNAGGALIIASEAEWKQTGRGKDDPDGILYLTDKALIFEQKEKKEKTFGLFGGKLVQEVEWSIPLGQISDVRSKNEGMFGGKDILFLTISTGDPAPEVKIEVKGSSDNKAWVAFITKTQQGAPIVDTPQTALPDIDLSDWTALPMPNAGVGFSMSFAGKGGEKSADDDSDDGKNWSKGGEKSADDDSDDGKNWSKGGEKSGGTIGGGPKGGQKSD